VFQPAPGAFAALNRIAKRGIPESIDKENDPVETRYNHRFHHQSFIAEAIGLKLSRFPASSKKELNGAGTHLFDTPIT
jgi:hypothetical protein